MSSNFGWEELEPLLEGSPSTSQVLKLIHPLQVFAKNENLDTAQLRQLTHALLRFFTRTTDRKLRNDIVATLIAFLDKSPVSCWGSISPFFPTHWGQLPGQSPQSTIWAYCTFHRNCSYIFRRIRNVLKQTIRNFSKHTASVQPGWKFLSTRGRVQEKILL